MVKRWRPRPWVAGHIALQAPDDLPPRQPLSGPPGQIIAGWLMPTPPDHHHPVQRRGGLAVPTPVQAVPYRLARRGRDREALAGGDQQRPAISGPTPHSCRSSGAAWVVSRSSSASTLASSPSKAWSRPPNRRRASLVAAVVVATRVVARWRPSWLADLRFLITGRDRSCPLHSMTCRVRVYPSCTDGRSRLARRFSTPVLRDQGQIDRPGTARPM
jgi:hypothetical protein